MQYDKVIKEMKKRMEAQEKRYNEVKAKRQEDLMIVAKEIDFQMDRRRRRKKKTGS